MALLTAESTAAEAEHNLASKEPVEHSVVVLGEFPPVEVLMRFLPSWDVLNYMTAVTVRSSLGWSATDSLPAWACVP